MEEIRVITMIQKENKDDSDVATGHDALWFISELV